MANFLDTFLKRSTKSSAHTAKERLRLVLIHDRTDLSPAILEAMKDEIIAVISRHVAINPAEVEINLSQDEHQSRLVANIPLLSGGARRAPERRRKGK